jgi:hypothetical protein
MTDGLFLGLASGIVVVTWGLVVLCERLMRGTR